MLTTNEGDKLLDGEEQMDTREDNETIDVKMVNGGDTLDEPPPGFLDDQLDTEDDASRSEATFRFVVENVSKLKESALSPPYMVRNLPWKIMAMPRQNPSHDRSSKSLGFFLQCNGDAETPSWSCSATAELRLISQKEGVENINRKINHVFYSKENDWGFSHFIGWNELSDPEKGYCKDDTIILEVHVIADAPHGVSWDSKKHTGYVGLKNQGATCYMNSLLQTLFFTFKLRKAVYQMPTESDDSSKSVALALQRVFYDLQFSDRPVGTKKLTKSFGWETLDSFMQHDVQELCRVLLDNMEGKMKGTAVEGTIPKLFEGKMVSFLRCKNVDYTSSRIEPFYDIQLNIKGKKNIYESFKEYTQIETLEGDNKYDAGDYGLQDAEKGIFFKSFPPVLHLHLLRFQYDPLTDTNIKINDRFEFPETLDLQEYLKETDEEEQKAKYTLQAVLVHSGDNHGGHYVVFINPKGDGKWCKFDDDVVSKCSKTDAVEQNFGGNDDDVSVRHSTNAYMLVYIREDAMETVSDDDIPEHLKERFTEEKRQEALRRKERSEAHLYMTINAFTEDSFISHRGVDLFDPEKSPYQQFRVRKSITLKEAVATIAAQMNYPEKGMRIWPMSHRANETFRPTSSFYDLNRPIVDVAENASSWNVFLELVEADAPVKELPSLDKDHDVLLFFKMYDPRHKILSYFCRMHRPANSMTGDLIPILCEKAGFPPGTPIDLYEEVKPNLIDKITELNLPLNKVLDELMDGDIIVFQRTDLEGNFELPTVKHYYEDLQQRVEVSFCDKTVPNDTGFLLELSLKMNYEQIANEVSRRLGVDPYLIQFFRPSGYRDPSAQVQPVKCGFEGTLKDLLVYFRPKQQKKLMYQILTIKINELENKKQFKCFWVNSKLKEEKELMLYPNKSGTVADVLEEAKRHVIESPDSSGKLRLLEISSCRITMVCSDEYLLECLNSNSTKSFRIEEIPKDEARLEAGEFLVPVAHFHKETYQTFGTPFLFKLKAKEPVSQVRERIQKKLEIPDKEFEKYRLAAVSSNKPHFFEETDFITREDFGSPSLANNKPWLGLEHVNKTPKRSRYNYLEKAVKIYN